MRGRACLHTDHINNLDTRWNIKQINPQGTGFLQRRQVTLRRRYALLMLVSDHKIPLPIFATLPHPLSLSTRSSRDCDLLTSGPAMALVGYFHRVALTLQAVPWLLTRTHVHSEVGACLALHARASASTCGRHGAHAVSDDSICASRGPKDTEHGSPTSPRHTVCSSRLAVKHQAGLLTHKLKHTSIGSARTHTTPQPTRSRPNHQRQQGCRCTSRCF